MYRTALFCLFFGACSLPSESDLYGVWVNLDRGALTVYEFSETFEDVPESRAYRLYEYAAGNDAVLTQYGNYETTQSDLVEAGDTRPALVTTVLWSLDSSQEGQTYGDEIVDWESDGNLTLFDATAPNSARVFTWSEIIP